MGYFTGPAWQVYLQKEKKWPMEKAIGTPTFIYHRGSTDGSNSNHAWSPSCLLKAFFLAFQYLHNRKSAGGRVEGRLSCHLSCLPQSYFNIIGIFNPSNFLQRLWLLTILSPLISGKKKWQTWELAMSFQIHTFIYTLEKHADCNLIKDKIASWGSDADRSKMGCETWSWSVGQLREGRLWCRFSFLSPAPWCVYSWPWDDDMKRGQVEGVTQFVPYL